MVSDILWLSVLTAVPCMHPDEGYNAYIIVNLISNMCNNAVFTLYRKRMSQWLLLMLCGFSAAYGMYCLTNVS